MRRLKISASIMCDPFRNLESSLVEMADASIDLVHVDIMDGTFVPNFTLGPDFIRAIKGMSAIPVDVHLMAITPEKHLDTFVGILEAEKDYLSIHQEACLPLARSVLRIKDAGIKAGVALNPATSVGMLESILPIADFVVLMMVEPGFAGQSIVPAAMDKIPAMRRMSGELRPDLEIEVDGNVSFENAREMAEHGADMLVAGTSSIFRPGMGIAEGTRQLKELLDGPGGEQI